MNPKPRYPDLTPLLDILADRLEEALADTNRTEAQHLVNKWIDQLLKIHDEMRHLERLETFTAKLKPFPTKGPTA